jgi:hypothetical protein
MTLKERREIALSAARGQLRAHGIEPKAATIDEYEAALDELAWQGTIAGDWYLEASDNQWKMFKRDLRKWQTP